MRFSKPKRLASPKGLRTIAQGCRPAATLGSKGLTMCKTPTGFRKGNTGTAETLSGLTMIVAIVMPQGSRCATTLRLLYLIPSGFAISGKTGPSPFCSHTGATGSLPARVFRTG